MARILVTGGPVHAHLDAVKIVTNRFKGGRMVALAEALGEKGHFVTFVGSPHGKKPNPDIGLLIDEHQGFSDYRALVRRHAEDCDMVILGAAVANLIPCPPWDVTKKFPSHDYREGEEVMVPFRVAPRIINEVKRFTPRTTLVGFKLLQGASNEELVRAAHIVIDESNAAFVVANDADDLARKLIVTRERSVISAIDLPGITDEYLKTIGRPVQLVDFLDQVARDEHYTTEVREETPPTRTKTMDVALERFNRVFGYHKRTIEAAGRAGNKVLGCLAITVGENGFLISERAKKLAHQKVYVSEVDHTTRRVVSHGGKPSLNAPLIDWLLRENPRAWGVLHHHGWGAHLPTYHYAPPGTVRDSQRSLSPGTMEFEIKHHGVFKLLTDEDYGK